MSQTLKSLGIDQLIVAQRILLVEEIWDSIAVEADEAPLTEAQEEDLRRRLKSYSETPKAGSSWDEVKAASGKAVSRPITITPEAEADITEVETRNDQRNVQYRVAAASGGSD